MDRPGEAREALRSAQQEFGDTTIIQRTREYLGGAVAEVMVATTAAVDPVGALKAAMHDLKSLTAAQQAAVVSTAPEPLVEFVIRCVRTVGAALANRAAILQGLGIDKREEHITAIFEEILRPHFGYLGWELAGEPKGGVTAKGNQGERDLVIRRGAVELAVLEALMTRERTSRAFTVRDLASHFQRVNAYSKCRLFFVIAYSYAESTGTVIAKLREIASLQAPPGLSLVECVPLDEEGSMPGGFVARYLRGSEESRTVFLVMDMFQGDLLEAAKAAARTNPR
jgi:hypothetical protein